MDEERFITRVMRLGAFTGHADALRAIRATLIAIGERLHDDERSALMRALPAPLRTVLERAAYAGDFDEDELFARVARHGDLERGVAVEQAEIVCAALASELPLEPLTRLRKELGPKLSRLLTEEEEIPTVPRTIETAGSTLASGRMGSRHPVSEARVEPKR